MHPPHSPSSPDGDRRAALTLIKSKLRSRTPARHRYSGVGVDMQGEDRHVPAHSRSQYGAWLGKTEGRPDLYSPLKNDGKKYGMCQLSQCLDSRTSLRRSRPHLPSVPSRSRFESSRSRAEMVPLSPRPTSQSQSQNRTQMPFINRIPKENMLGGKRDRESEREDERDRGDSRPCLKPHVVRSRLTSATSATPATMAHTPSYSRGTLNQGQGAIAPVPLPTPSPTLPRSTPGMLPEKSRTLKREGLGLELENMSSEDLMGRVEDQKVELERHRSDGYALTLSRGQGKHESHRGGRTRREEEMGRSLRELQEDGRRGRLEERHRRAQRRGEEEHHKSGHKLWRSKYGWGDKEEERKWLKNERNADFLRKREEKMDLTNSKNSETKSYVYEPLNQDDREIRKSSERTRGGRGGRTKDNFFNPLGLENSNHPDHEMKRHLKSTTDLKNKKFEMEENLKGSDKRGGLKPSRPLPLDIQRDMDRNLVLHTEKARKSAQKHDKNDFFRESGSRFDEEHFRRSKSQTRTFHEDSRTMHREKAERRKEKTQFYETCREERSGFDWESKVQDSHERKQRDKGRSKVNEEGRPYVPPQLHSHAYGELSQEEDFMDTRSKEGGWKEHKGREGKRKPLEKKKKESAQDKEEVDVSRSPAFSESKLVEFEEAANAAPPSIQCEDCGRMFSEKAIDKHSKICKKVFCSKRREFNVAAARLAGLQGAKPVSKENKKTGKKFSWRTKSEQFRAAIGRSSNDDEKRMEAEARFKEIEAEVEASDMMKCPHCSRTFNKDAAPRHINICQKMFGSKGGRLKKGSGKVAHSTMKGGK